MKIWMTCLLLMLTSCSSESKPLATASMPVKGEYIYRHHDDTLFKVEPMTPAKRPEYPWELGKGGEFPKITKDFFRCKGSSLNPVHIIPKEKETTRYYDCGGPQKHSLPLRNQKEFVYPILIDLLNALQTKTGKRVVITCGHCCPDHNLYLDPSTYNQASKHLLAAEVDFYIQGMEEEPQKVVDLILDYYKENPKYKGQKEYYFLRYDKKEKINITTPPCYNKEIFIKLYKKDEGRDLDNRHPYPYISIQVRYDEDLNEKVNYSWERAYHNFHRY